MLALWLAMVSHSHLDMALGPQVVHLVGPNLSHNANQDVHVGQIAVMEEEALLVRVGGVHKVVEPLLVIAAGPALDPVHNIALVEQQLREVRAVLAGDARDHCHLPGGVTPEAVSGRRGRAGDNDGILKLGTASSTTLLGGGSHKGSPRGAEANLPGEPRELEEGPGMGLL